MDTNSFITKVDYIKEYACRIYIATIYLLKVSYNLPIAAEH